jgi:hypothetical protein
MNMHKLLLGYMAFALIILAGCGPNETDLAATIESRVSAAVLATQAVQPAATADPTTTPYPTYTPLPTYTPPPTQTPYPTQTALPTYTPLPTETAVATETATATTAAAASGNPVPPAAAATSASPTTTSREQLAASLATALRHLDGFIYEMQAKCIKNCGTGFSVTMEYVARCPQLIDAYQGVMNSRPAGFATNDAQLQAIYNIFSQEVSKFDEMTSGWANDCGQLLASGIETKDVPPSQGGLLSNSLREIVHTLNQLQSELAD